MLRTAVIGLGKQGKKYALMLYNNEVSNMTLTAVVARSEETASWAEENLKGVKIYPNTDTLFNNYISIDSIVITTPHKSHIDIASEAIERNIAVLCDKPIGLDLKTAQKLCKKAEKENVPFALMFNNRVQPVYKWLKNTLDSGKIGAVKRILFKSTSNFRTAYYHNSANWRSSWEGEGGGALINQGQHLLDIWCWLFGEPKKILAYPRYGVYNNFDVDDECTIIMEYKDKSGVFIISTGEPGGSDIIEVVGTEGRILIDGTHATLYTYENSIDYIMTAKVNNDSELVVSKQKIDFPREKKPYHIMLENFADYVEGRAEAIAPAKTGLAPLKICKLAYKF